MVAQKFMIPSPLYSQFTQGNFLQAGTVHQRNIASIHSIPKLPRQTRKVKVWRALNKFHRRLENSIKLFYYRVRSESREQI